MKMRASAFYFFIFSLYFFCISCGVSYPKEKLNQMLVEMVKKDTGIDCHVEKQGKTLYMDAVIEDLTSSDQDKLMQAFKKMQSAVIDITRAVLSSDSEIKYMVVNCFNEDKQVLFRMITNVDDIKAYMYMRISKEDYESRSLIEIEGHPAAEQSIEDKHDISDDEYVARLIVSQINMTARQNPILGALIQLMQLRYLSSQTGNLTFSGADVLDDKLKNFMSNTIGEQAKKYSKNYSLDLKNVDIVNSKGESILNIAL